MASRWLKIKPRGGRWAEANARWAGRSSPQASGASPPSSAGSPIGLLLALTKAS